MKTVSKLFTAATIAFAAVACQVIDEGQIVTRQIEVTATIAEDDESKVDYDVDNDSYTISPTWHYNKDKPEECDQIIGFDNLGNTFTFTVSGVSGNGKIATFKCSYVPPTGATTLYAIYAPGNDSTDISDKTLSVDLASQYGVLDGRAPVLMCATATIKDGKVNFQFTNQTAIIGVKKFQLNGSTTSHTVTSMTLNGVITNGTFELDGDDNLVLRPGSTTSSITAEGSWPTDASGICTTSVYFAAMPTTEADMTLTATTTTATYNNLSSINQVDIVAGRYYHMTKKLGHPVAAIGRERYDSINAAFEAADASTDACTITLLDHCNTSEQLLIDDENNGAVTLDLNGKTLNCSDSYSAYIYIRNGRSFTITDKSNNDVAQQGTIQTSIANYIVYNSGGTLNIAEGNLISNSNNYAIYTSGTATISGGKITSNKKGIYVDSGANLTISSGEIESKDQCVYNYGNTSIEGGSFASTNEDATSTEVVASVNEGAIVTVTGGYFSAARGYFYPTSYFGELFVTRGSSGSQCRVSGGYFDRPVNSGITRNTNNNARSHTLNTNSDTKERYPYRVGNFEGGYPFVVTVGSGTLTYWHNNLSSAARQAKDASSDVLIKMRASTTSDQTAVNLTNDANNNITLDLNGCTLTTKTYSFITTTGTALLTIKDSKSGSDKGMITSNKKNIISLTTAGAKITLDGCIIESTADASDTNLDAPILLNYTSTTNRPQLTIENGAQVYTENAVTAIYGKYSQLTLNSCEITSGTKAKGSGRYGVFVTTGLQLDVNNDASIYSTGSSAIYSGSGNAATSIQINGGYMYGTPNALTAGKSGEYSSVFTISGGFFNSDVNTISGSTAATINNGFIGLCPETEHHTPKPTNVELDYSYQYQSAVARIDYTGYANLADAVDAAKSGSSDATITLLTDITYDADATITLNNTNTKIVTLDLYGHILTAGAEKFIKGTKFTITDSKGTGKIESAYNDIIYPNYANSEVTLKGCKIESTKPQPEGGTKIASRAIYNFANNSSITLRNGATIIAASTAIFNYNSGSSSSNVPKIIIENGTITAVDYCVYVGASGILTVKDGSLYSSTYVPVYASTNTCSIDIQGGYFYTGANYYVLGSSDSGKEKYTITGGYFKTNASNLTGSTGIDNIQILDTPASHTHPGVGELNYSYQYVEP